MFFSVIMLVGTGWSLLKPFLNIREKKILLAVLPLQVIDNIALVVMEEMSPVSKYKAKERASRMEHCSEHFYSSSLLQTYFIIFVVFFFILKHVF